MELFRLHCAAAAWAQKCDQLVRLMAMRPPGVPLEGLECVAAAFTESFLTLQLVAAEALGIGR